MTTRNSVSRFSQRGNHVSSSPNGANSSNVSNSMPSTGTTLRLVPNDTKGLFSSKDSLDQAARERVFDSIVRKTLENPNHPYYSVSPQIHRDMVRSVIEQLIPSHYYRSSQNQKKPRS